MTNPDDYNRPQHHSTTWLAAHKLAPCLASRHEHYKPAAWSIRLTSLGDFGNDTYLNGSPAELHNVALAILAAADQATHAEAEAQRIAEAERIADDPAAHVTAWALAELAEDDVEGDRWTTGDPSPIDLLR